MTAPPTLWDAQRRPVALSKELTRDEDNALYLVMRRPEVLAKVWFDPLDRRQAERVLALVAARHGSLEDVCAWPTASLHDAAGAPCGFLMVRLDQTRFRPLPQLYPAQSAGGWPHTWAFRMLVGQHLAQAFAAFHAAGQVIGNVNEHQIFFSAQGEVQLTGADHFQLNAPQGTFPARTSAQALTPPELQAGGLATQQRTPEHDNFSLAVLLFKLLFMGRHPYSGTPLGRPMPSPGEAIARGAYAYAQPPRADVKAPPGVFGPEVLPAAVRHLFGQAFSPDCRARPSAHDWHLALRDLSAALLPCENNPAHRRAEGRPCPQCVAAPPGTPSAPRPGPRSELTEAVQRLWQKVEDTPAPDKPPAAPLIPDPARLPPLPLGLPAKPRSLLGPGGQEGALRWILRLTALLGVMALAVALQHSVLAAAAEIAVVVLVLTVGRRFSVDWDSLIDQFQNAEGRLVERLTPAQGQWQRYYAATEQKRDELRRRLQELRGEYSDLEDRYSEENVYAQYQRERHRLDGQRRQLLQPQPACAAQRLVQEEESRALADYLKRQVVAPNTVPNLSPRTALQLTNMGVRRASDVQSDKLKTVRGDLAEALLEWRTELVQFFHFNPDSLSAEQLAAAQQQEQAQTLAAFRAFDEGVRRFAATDWPGQENTIAVQMRDLKAQAKQHQNALKALDEVSRS